MYETLIKHQERQRDDEKIENMFGNEVRDI